jgi:hypothetical protein
VLEVVPWVDKKVSERLDNRKPKIIINQCKTSALARSMPNSDDFCICLQQKFKKNILFRNFKITPYRTTKVYKDFGASCGNETIIAKGVNDDMRFANKALLKMIMLLQ